MSPLRIEAFNPSTHEWLRVGEVGPQDRPGSMSDNKPDGKRDVYQLECAEDDSRSIISRSQLGIDLDSGGTRNINSKGFEVIKNLAKEQSFEMSLTHDGKLEPRRYRFTHT